MSDLVLFTRDGSVGVITVNNPPVNALSPGVPEGIQEAVRENQDDDAIDAFVLIGPGRASDATNVFSNQLRMMRSKARLSAQPASSNSTPQWHIGRFGSECTFRLC